MALGWANAWEDYKATGETGCNRQDRKMWLCNGNQQPPRTNCFSLQGTAGCLHVQCTCTFPYTIVAFRSSQLADAPI